MLDLIVQDKFAKLRVINYWIDYRKEDKKFIIRGHCFVNGSIVELGTYSTKENVEKVFNKMIDAEEKQKTLKADYHGTDFGDFAVTTLKFKIFKMPLEDEVS